MTTYMSGSGRTSFGGGGMSAGRLTGRAGSSVYGGAGGQDVKISRGFASKSFSSGGAAGFASGSGYGGSAGYSSGGAYGGGGGGGAGFSFGGGGGGGAGMEESMIGNEKFTMQNLNDRLANYLGKVADLEKANTDLELKIKGFLESKASPAARDYSAFYITIADLQGKIQTSLLERSSVLLGIDNATLAGDDFRVKYENELAMRQSVEADIAGLKMVLGELGQAKTDLSMQIEELMEEMAYLKKNHEEDMLSARTTVGGVVNVEVDAAPQTDMMTVMQDIRDHYEAMALKSSKELESWFQSKVESVKTEVAAQDMAIQTSSTETKEVKSQLQALEIELQSQFSMKASMEAALADTQNRYGMVLDGFQNKVTSMEGHLIPFREDLAQQGQEYEMLLNIKARLEMEIAEYRRLLDGEFGSTAGFSVLSKTITTEDGGKDLSSATTTTTTIVTTVEEVVSED